MSIVAFQGDHGAYSEEAVRRHFGQEVETLPCRAFEHIFDAVEQGAAKFAAVPVENSTAGSINKAYDLLLDHDLKVHGEILLRVHHNLLAVPGITGEIREVRSHHQALAQCEEFLNRNGYIAVPWYDTAGSAKDLAADPQPGVAVIASRLAAEVYGLEIVAEQIEDLKNNYTRFFVVGKGDAPHSTPSKTSLVFAVPNTPGALYGALSEFANREINLTKLESRPRRNRPWQYVFYADFDGHWEDENCRDALVSLLNRAAFVKLLGQLSAGHHAERRTARRRKQPCYKSETLIVACAIHSKEPTMIVVMKPEATAAQIGAVIAKAEQMGCQTHPIYGEERTVVALVGDLTHVTREVFDAMTGVAHTLRIQEPYKLSSRTTRPENTVIELPGTDIRIGGTEIVVMAGPCSVESRQQIIETAIAVKETGAKVLRGGAFKPRTSPYDFQGHGLKGLEYLAEAREVTGLPVITEVMTVETVPMVAEYADILQIGARNMQNYGLLHAVGKVQRPVMLKRGMSGTIKEWLMCAEYIISNGNYNVMLCERGIRTYETATRNTFDLNAVPFVKQTSHLPVVADPSHGTGLRELVPAMARASVAAGADAIIMEVHHDPDKAISDGRQSLTFEQFGELMASLRRVAVAMDRFVGEAPASPLAELESDLQTVEQSSISQYDSRENRA